MLNIAWSSPQQKNTLVYIEHICKSGEICLQIVWVVSRQLNSQMEKFWARSAFRVCLQVVWYRVPPTQGWSKGTQRSLAHGVMWSWGRGTAASPAELQTPHTGSGFMFWAGGQDRFSLANCRGRGRSSRLTTDRRPSQEGGMSLLAHSGKKKTGKPEREMDWSEL